MPYSIRWSVSRLVKKEYMTDVSKGTLYALLPVTMFAKLGTGFKMTVTRTNGTMGYART